MARIASALAVGSVAGPNAALGASLHVHAVVGFLNRGPAPADIPENTFIMTDSKILLEEDIATTEKQVNAAMQTSAPPSSVTRPTNHRPCKNAI